MNPTEPKPQTPLTDAECGDNKDGNKLWPSAYVSADFARSLELKLQEAQLTIENLKKVLNEQA